MKIFAALMTAALLIGAVVTATILTTPAVAISVANDYNSKLRKLSPTEQRAVMRRAVLDHNQYCKHIGPVAYQGPYKNLEMWVVKCDRGAAYGAFVGIDGSVQVRPCADLIEFKMPACKIPED